MRVQLTLRAIAQTSSPFTD